LMTKEGLINLDFADVRAIMSEMGKAMMGTGEASGEKRAIEAAEAAISNPLLDDVSMRGARGLLISICGGPDLTLYEVDEAATRIREEVDPEANIILGATFDDALEGTMRVSVVATGLRTEAHASDSQHDEEIQSAKSTSQVFGYTGQNQTAAKVLRPMPLVARAPIQAPVQHQDAIEEHYEEAAAEYVPEPTIARAPQQQRIPSIDQFPAIAQQQVAVQQGRIESIAEHAARRKKGLFERLADVGLGRREETPAPAPQPVAKRAEPKMQQPRMQEPAPQAEVSYDDDQLAIPAFLRRQAN
jgi:cell division protein FtsZ